MKNLIHYLLLASLVTVPLYATNDPILRVQIQGISSTVAALKGKIDQFKTSESQVAGLVYALKQAALSGIIGAGFGVVFPALIHCFTMNSGTFVDNVIEGAQFFIPYNVVNGLIQGFATGFAAGSGTLFPYVPIRDMVLMHTAHHGLTDAGICVISDPVQKNLSELLLVPVLLAVVEAVAAFYLRCDIDSDRTKLEEFLAVFPKVKPVV